MKKSSKLHVLRHCMTLYLSTHLPDVNNTLYIKRIDPQSILHQFFIEKEVLYIVMIQCNLYFLFAMLFHLIVESCVLISRGLTRNEITKILICLLLHNKATFNLKSYESYDEPLSD